MDPEKKITEEELELDNDRESYYEDSSDESVTENTEEHLLANTWTVWYHKLYDEDWTITGYKKIYTFSTIESFWKVYNSLIKPDETSNVPYIMRGDFFIMKDGILPMWEDNSNINGCSLSYLTQDMKKDDDFDEWMELCIYLISNHGKNLNGISSSPKQKKFLLKLWKADCEKTQMSGDFKINLTATKCKIHKESSASDEKKIDTHKQQPRQNNKYTEKNQNSNRRDFNYNRNRSGR